MILTVSLCHCSHDWNQGDQNCGQECHVCQDDQDFCQEDPAMGSDFHRQVRSLLEMMIFWAVWVLATVRQSLLWAGHWKGVPREKEYTKKMQLRKIISIITLLPGTVTSSLTFVTSSNVSLQPSQTCPMTDWPLRNNWWCKNCEKLWICWLFGYFISF